MEACGQHMLQKSADDFHDLEGKDSWAFAVRLAIANEDGAVLDIDDARVGEGDLEDVGARYLRLASLEDTAWQLTFQSICQTSEGI